MIPQPAPPGAGASDEVNIREIIDLIMSGKWVVAGITVVITLLATVYALSASPIYQSSGLVQVEHEKSGLNASINELSSLIGSGPTDTSAELAIIKSRMVLGTVVDNLKLYISVRPNYFPILGQTIARRNPDGFSTELPEWLRAYAWGGEKVQVTALDVPPSLFDKPFVLVVDGQQFKLLDSADELVLQGTVGQRSSIETPAGSIAIFVQEINAKPHTRFSVTRLSPQAILQSVANNVTVAETPKDSGVLSVQVENTDPKFAARLLNEIQDAYLKQNVERKSAQAEQSLDFLKKQLPVLRANVDAAQAQLNAYQLKRGTVDVQQETGLVLRRAVDLETQRLTLFQEREAALQRFTAQHPVIVTLSEQIRGLEREQATLKKQVESLPETQQEILSLMRDLEVNTQLYTALLNSAQQLQVTKAGTVGDVRIIDYGLVPLRPVKPNKKLIVVLGLGLGIFVGIATVFVLRALMRGVDRPEEVERILGLSTYASIPYSRAQSSILRKRTDLAENETLILAKLNGSDPAVEALRSLRTSLHFAMLEARNNIVMFTGPVAALGKSFVTINLGAVLAMSGKRVLVIDADLRRGQLHRYVGCEKTPGISDLVARTIVGLDAITHKTPIDGLFFIPGGTRPPNPSEILMSEHFSEALNDASKLYDYVLLDTPPVLPVADAAVVGRLAGTTLIVLKSAEHPMRAIEETVKRLNRSGVHVRGAIFNQVGARIASYGYGEYGYAYGYTSYGYKSKKS